MRNIQMIDNFSGEGLERRFLPSMGEWSRKKWISLGVRLIITLLLLFFLLKSLSWGDVWKVLQKMQLEIAVLGLGIGFLTRLVSVYQWQILLKTEQILIDLKRLFKLYLVGLAFNQFLPTSIGGDVVKAYYVGRDSGNMVGSISAVLLTRILGFFGMMLLALPALLIWQVTRQDKATAPVVFWLLIGCALVLMAFGCVWCFIHLFSGKGHDHLRIWSELGEKSEERKAFFQILVNKIYNNRIFRKIIEIGRALMRSARHPRSTIAAILLGTLFHIGASFNYYIYGLALHLQAPLHFYFIAIPLVALISLLPISVSGYGVRETGLAYIFSTAGVPIAQSLLMVLAMDLQVLIFAACGSGIYLFMRNQHS